MPKTAPEPAPDGNSAAQSGPAGFERIMPAEAGAVAGVRHDLDAWLAQRVAPARALDVTLCASEAMTNSIEHAYRGKPGGLVVVRVEIGADGLLLSVTDDGEWKEPDGAVGTEHGWGIPLIRSLADELDIHREPGRTTVTARFLG